VEVEDGMGRKGMSGDQLNYLWKLFCYNRKLLTFFFYFFFFSD